MGQKELDSLKKKFKLRRDLWGLFFIFLIFKIWYGRWEKLFPNAIDVIITVILVLFWIFSVIKSGRDAEKYIEYKKSGGKKYPNIKNSLKLQGWLNRFLAITVIGQMILGAILIIIILLAISILFYAGRTPPSIFNTKFIVSIIVGSIGVVFFIWLGLRIWRKSKSMIEGKVPKY